MGLIGGRIGYSLLRALAPVDARAASADQPPAASALVQAFGSGIVDAVRGKTVIDFGCGFGRESVEMARSGAAQVIGLDLQEARLAGARALAAREGLSDRCTFATRTDVEADIIVSKDAFEHFADPASILATMRTLVRPDGCVLASFGPTWLHPYGGHLFSIFPWAHLVFSEHALIRWRSDFKTDGATRFAEVEGGLNGMTIARFERLVDRSPFRIASLDTVPIRGIGLFKARGLREWGSSIVRCKLVPR